MAMDATEIEHLIKARFPDAEISIRDLAGDGDHYAAHVVTSAFAGKTRVQQQQMVYDALGGRMGGTLRALLCGGARVLGRFRLADGLVKRGLGLVECFPGDLDALPCLLRFAGGTRRLELFAARGLFRQPRIARRDRQRLARGGQPIAILCT